MPDNLTDSEFENFSKLIYAKAGINLQSGKKELLRARLSKRLRDSDFLSFQEYYDYVVEDRSGEELILLLDSVSTNLTSFFREAKHFRYLEEAILPQLLEERKKKLQQATADQIEARYELIYQRQLLVKEIRAHIPRLQRNHPEYSKTLVALWKEVNAKAFTEEAINTYRLTFNNFIKQKVFPVLEEEQRRQRLEAEKREQLSEIDSLISKVNTMNKRYKEFGVTNEKLENWYARLTDDRKKVEAGQVVPIEDWLLPTMISIGMPQLETTLAEIKKEKEEEKRQRNFELGKLKVRLKGINYYLRRNRFDAAAKEDPLLILQKLEVISPIGFPLGPAKGSWESNWLYGKLEYKPPTRNFVDIVGKTHSNRDIQTWVNWQAIYPLLQAAHQQLQTAVKRLDRKADIRQS